MNYKKYILIILITLLLFSFNLVNLCMATSISCFQSSKNTTYYVGGSGSGNYSTIQAAVDNASDGDTVFVYAGVYNESIVLSKSLSLIGEHRTDTIINGVDSSNLATLFLTGSDSSIQRFTIGEGEGKCRTGIYLWSSLNNSISHCTFLMDSSGHPGVYAMEIHHESCDNIIKNCSVFSKFKGINIGGGSDRNQIVNCDFTIPGVSEDGVSGDDSIKIWDGCYDNVIANCSMVGGDGIMVWGSNTRVLNCVIRDTIGNMGFDLAYCSHTVLRNNTLVNASFHFRVNEPDELLHDIDSSNTINGKPMYYLVGEEDFRVDDSWNPGFLGLAFCNNVTIENIRVQGIAIGGSSNIKILDCRIHHSSGIAGFYSEYVTVSNCSVSSSDMGVDMDYCSNCSISHCSFFGGISGVGLSLYCENVTVSHSVARNCQVHGFGIGGKNHVVDNVTATNITYWGIRIGGNNNVVSHCVAANTSIGIGVDGDHGIFKYNMIRNNKHGMFCLYGSNNDIYRNNFIDNTFNANSSFPNTWEENYWDDWVGLKNPWLGFLPYHVSITYSQELVRTFLHSFDWHPASEPYDISNVECQIIAYNR